MIVPGKVLPVITQESFKHGVFYLAYRKLHLCENFLSQTGLVGLLPQQLFTVSITRVMDSYTFGKFQIA